MIELFTDEGRTTVLVAGVDKVTGAKAAQRTLLSSIRGAAMIHGGEADQGTLALSGIRPAYLVVWRDGPQDWATAYCTSPESSNRTIVAYAWSEDTVAFEDVD